MTNESKVYLENLNIMRDVVSQVRNMQEPDVDQLVPLTEQGLKARKHCLERIDAVERSLGINIEKEQG
jgi:hypothetical protein